jgi:hypothetical protein
MTMPNENPYPKNNQVPSTQVPANKGSMIIGFLIGWGIMFVSSTLIGILFSLAQGFGDSLLNGSDRFFITIGIIGLAIPVLGLIAAMIWFGKKGQSKAVIGISLSLVSLIAIVGLLVAACFGMIAR